MLQLLDRSHGLAALLPTFNFRSPRQNPPDIPAPALAPPPAAAQESLRRCADTLAPFIQESETALTAIGSVMADLFEGAVHIRGDAEAARDSIASMADSANAQLLEIGHSLQRASAQINGNRELLESLDHRLSCVIHDFAGLESGVREFRVVGTLIRIEGSMRALDSDDFVNISERSAAITGNLGELVAQIQKATAALRVAFRSVAREINQLNTTSFHAITAVTRDITALGKVMSAEHGAIGSAAQKTLHGLEVIRQSIGDLVCALQIHDILRQQSEHSLAAIQDIHRLPEMPAAGYHACQAVVHAQITHTLSLCQEASQKVEDGLHSANTQLRGIADTTGNISGLTRMDAPSRQAAEASTSAILAALPVIEKGDAALRRAMDDILTGTAAILAVIDKVSNAMLDMRWLGLNAVIQSANRPDQGSAIELLGSRTVSVTNGVDQECLRIRAEINHLRQEIHAYTEATVGSLGERSIRQVAEDSVVLLDSVHRSIRSTMGRQSALQQSLQNKLENANGALARFRDTQTPPAQAVAQLGSGHLADAPAAQLSPATSALLDTWFSRYTMASERRVHCATLGLPFTEIEGDAPPEGDIELF